jgi:hypothetical protein
MALLLSARERIVRLAESMEVCAYNADGEREIPPHVLHEYSVDLLKMVDRIETEVAHPAFRDLVDSAEVAELVKADLARDHEIVPGNGSGQSTPIASRKVPGVEGVLHLDPEKIGQAARLLAEVADPSRLVVTKREPGCLVVTAALGMLTANLLDRFREHEREICALLALTESGLLAKRRPVVLDDLDDDLPF